MRFSPLIKSMIDVFQCLPGVGPKSAQRMVFYLLSKNREAGKQLAFFLQEGMEKICHCKKCRMYCEEEICGICQDQKRDHNLLCVVESPANVLVLEQAGGYHGLYFVLLGHLSPMDGIGPYDIGADLFKQRLKDGLIKEVIMATNLTVEGDATAYYLSELASRFGIETSRIAHGVPIGGDLEYVDIKTLSKALADRRTFA